MCSLTSLTAEFCKTAALSTWLIVLDLLIFIAICYASLLMPQMGSGYTTVLIVLL